MTIKHPFFALLLPAALTLGACASSVDGTSRDPADASAVDAPADAAPTSDRATCPPRAELPRAPMCASLTELATPGNTVAETPDTYALSDLRPMTNTHRPATVTEPWQDRADTRVRFTAPRGGRWRFSASGEELWALDLRRGCDTPAASAGYPDMHGPHASNALTVDVQVQRGESLSVALDGCPVGATCRYALRAQRVADLACEFDRGPTTVCAGANEACAIDPCDAERFQCARVMSRTPTLGAIRVYASEDRGRAVFVGSARPDGPVADRTQETLFVRWFDASGAPLTEAMGAYLGSVTLTRGDFTTFSEREIPRGATRGLFWFYEATHAEGAGVAANVERWAPPRDGEPCSPASAVARCDEGYRCVTLGESARGLCRRAPTVEVSRVRAWRDAAGSQLRASVEGFGAGESLSRLSVDLLDQNGSVLASAPLVAVVFNQERPSNIPFETSFVVVNDSPAESSSGFDRSFRITRALARVRVVAMDTTERRSAPVEAPVMVTAEAGLGAFCDDPSVSCSTNLRCVLQGGASRRRCESEVPMRGCGSWGSSVTWAPPSSGATYVLEGAAHSIGGGTRCLSGRTQQVTQLEFVAPVRGRYAFDLRGYRVLEVRAGCDTARETSVCEMAPTGSTEVHLEVDLAAGQRAPMTLMSDPDLYRAAPFTLSVRVP